jgi:type I restriction enzyme S subunit
LAEQARIAEVVGMKLNELRQAETSLKSALEGVAVQDKEIFATAATGHLVENESDIAGRNGKAFETGAQALVRTLAQGAADLDLFGPTSRKPKDPPTRDPLPSGWAWTTMADAGEVMLGKMREPRRHTGSNMRPYLRVANVFEARIDISDVHEMHFSKQEAEAYALKKGDILLNEGQSPELVGRPAMFNGELPNACFQNTLIRFRANSAVNPDFALLVFRHYLHAGIFMRAAQWSTNIAHLSKTRFSALPFPVPPRAEQRRIVAEAQQRLKASKAQREAIEKSLARIPEMLTLLLNTAMSATLVPQDAHDEPADELLVRLGPVPRDVISLVRIPDAAEIVPVTQPSDSDNAPMRKLSEVLLEANRPMALPDLCHAAGFDRNSVGDIERFYIALRTELGTTIRVVASKSENASAEAVDATR